MSSRTCCCRRTCASPSCGRARRPRRSRRSSIHPLSMIGTDGVLIGRYPSPRAFGTLSAHPRRLRARGASALAARRDPAHVVVRRDALRARGPRHARSTARPPTSSCSTRPPSARRRPTRSRGRRRSASATSSSTASLVVDDGRHTGATPGRALRRGRRGLSRSCAHRTRSEERMRITGVRVDVVDMGRANAIYVRIDTDRDLTGTGETVLKRRDRTRRDEPARDRRVPRRQGRARDRGPLREALPRHVLAGRPAARRRPERGRHRAVGSQGPVLQRADLPDAGRADARRDPHLRPRRDRLDARTSSSRTCGGLVDRGYRAAKTGLPLFYGEKGSPSRSAGPGTSDTPGSLGPSLKETEYLPTHVFADMARWFAAAREAIGWEFELMVDCHGRLNLPNAVRLADALAPYRLLFIEEPLPPESAVEFARLSARVRDARSRPASGWSACGTSGRTSSRARSRCSSATS